MNVKTTLMAELNPVLLNRKGDGTGTLLPMEIIVNGIKCNSSVNPEVM
jgi:hypothetical protein